MKVKDEGKNTKKIQIELIKPKTNEKPFSIFVNGPNSNYLTIKTLHE